MDTCKINKNIANIVGAFETCPSNAQGAYNTTNIGTYFNT